MRRHVISDIGEFVQSDADISDLRGYESEVQVIQ
jgi:hypothetical protein